MKYKFINKEKILKVSPLAQKLQEAYIYANEEENPVNKYKDLVIEDRPTHNPETQTLYSWFEDGEVITQKFKIIDKE